jgi:hypothetical protein
MKELPPSPEQNIKARSKKVFNMGLAPFAVYLLPLFLSLFFDPEEVKN